MLTNLSSVLATLLLATAIFANPHHVPAHRQQQEQRQTKSCSEQYSSCKNICSQTCSQSGQACYVTGSDGLSFLTRCNGECLDKFNSCDDTPPPGGDGEPTVGVATCAELEVVSSCEGTEDLGGFSTLYAPIDPTTCDGPDVDQSYPVYRSVNPIPDSGGSTGELSYYYIFTTDRSPCQSICASPYWWIKSAKPSYCGELGRYWYTGRFDANEEPFLFDESEDSVPRVGCRWLDSDRDYYDLEIRCNRMVGEDSGVGGGGGGGGGGGNGTSGAVKGKGSLAVGILTMGFSLYYEYLA